MLVEKCGDKKDCLQIFSSFWEKENQIERLYNQRLETKEGSVKAQKACISSFMCITQHTTLFNHFKTDIYAVPNFFWHGCT